MFKNAELIIAPALILSATSFGNNLEVPIGGFGVSVEHILLLIYLFILILRKHGNSSIEFGLVFIVFAAAGILGMLNGLLLSLHLVSLALLCMMFPLFIRFFDDGVNPRCFVIISFFLIVIQCVFLPNRTGGFETWDYLVLEGFGRIQRLSILGFISNSLGLMLLPFCIYFLYQARNNTQYKIFFIFLFLIALALIFATFSRTAIFLVLIAFVLLSDIKVFAILIIAVTALLFSVSDTFFEFIFLSLNRESNVFENTRILLWLEQISFWSIGEFFSGGIGLLNPPLDNSYLSVIIGAGFIGTLGLFGFFFAFARWLKCVRKQMTAEQFSVLLIVFGALLISANTYDIFSQRKILFGTALVVGALVGNARYLHFRR